MTFDQNLTRLDIQAGLLEFFDADSQNKQIANDAFWAVYGQSPDFMPKFIGGLLVEAQKNFGDLPSHPNRLSMSLQDATYHWFGPMILVDSNSKPMPESAEEQIRKDVFRKQARAEFKRFFAVFFKELQTKLCAAGSPLAKTMSVTATTSAVSTTLVAMSIPPVLATALLAPLVILTGACLKGAFCKMKLERIFSILDDSELKYRLPDDRVPSTRSR
jgi:hypothetical protein